MSKQARGWLMAAGALILVGCILFAGVMTTLQWDFSKLGTVRLVTTTHDIVDEFDHIALETDTADVVFVPSDGECRVVCREEQNAAHTVGVQDRTLVIRGTDDRHWYQHIGISFRSPKITVYLPKAVYGALSIKGSTGDIELPQGLSFDAVDIAVSTGDIELMADAVGAIKVHTSTGDIHIEGASADEMALSVSTGHIDAEDITCAKDMTVRVSTGKIALQNVQCGALASVGSTGDVDLKNVVATGSFSIERSTGDVKLNGCDAAEMVIKTSTGDVTGRLLSDKMFIANASTGDVDVPKSTVGGRCEVTTGTGDIKLRVD